MKSLWLSLLMAGLVGATSACQKSDSPQAAASVKPVSRAPNGSHAAVNGISITGNQVAYIKAPQTYQLSVPSGDTVLSATWDFGDQTATVSGTGAVTHTYNQLGVYEVSATVVDSVSGASVVTFQVNAINFADGFDCVLDTTITVPATGVVGVPVPGTANLGACLSTVVTSVTWDFGDGSAIDTGTTAQNTYAAAGTYLITVLVNSPLAASGSAWLTFTQTIVISDVATPTPTPLPTATPTPVPTASPTPTPSATPTPTPSATPTPTPVPPTPTPVPPTPTPVPPTPTPVPPTPTPVPPTPTPVPPTPTPVPPTPTPIPTTYAWVATNNWTTCSADCGGTQTQIFICQSSTGATVDGSLCAQPQPVVQRACDGNPSNVNKTVTTVTLQDNPKPGLCPANQVGHIVDTRDVTTSTTYACVDHTVQTVNTSVTYGKWTEESRCQDIVAQRCSEEFLSPSEVRGRYDWMMKCQLQSPGIQKFFIDFPWSIDLRRHYVSFSTHAGPGSADKLWRAPVDAGAPCALPRETTVTAVCSSSGALSSEEILSQGPQDKDFKNISFIDALNANTPFVAAVNSGHSATDLGLARTKVETWATNRAKDRQEMIVFHMKSGRTLRVTANHALVSSNGRVYSAYEFRAGDRLIRSNGTLETITKIEAGADFTKVYNVFVDSARAQRNVVVTNGFLVGTDYFQTTRQSSINRALFRQNLIRGIFAAVSTKPLNLSKSKVDASATASLVGKMKRYGDLSHRVFLSRRESSEKAALVADRHLIDGIAGLLKDPSALDVLVASENLPNDMIDLLFESLTAHPGGAAENALRGLVIDGQIEGNTVDAWRREWLAGFKGEILYQWSAQDPKKEKQLEAWLPGPTSHQLWQNVLALQKQNQH
jgi:PKD repeat protein